MSEKVIRICDVIGEGHHAPNDDVHADARRTYNIEGVTYTVDVCRSHEIQFEAFALQMAQWAKWGTASDSAGQVPVVRKRRRDRLIVDPETAAVRAWAQENGLETTDWGAIPAPIKAAYREAHPPKNHLALADVGPKPEFAPPADTQRLA